MNLQVRLELAVAKEESAELISLRNEAVLARRESKSTNSTLPSLVIDTAGPNNGKEESPESPVGFKPASPEIDYLAEKSVWETMSGKVHEEVLHSPKGLAGYKESKEELPDNAFDLDETGKDDAIPDTPPETP